MDDKAISSLETGDTLITAKRTLEALLVLSQQNRKSVLLPILYKDPSLRISTAHLNRNRLSFVDSAAIVLQIRWKQWTH